MPMSIYNIPEINTAAEFVASFLYGKLPRRSADLYAQELKTTIFKKINNHWYTENSAKGSAFRCFHFSSKEIDPAFKQAAEAAGVDFNEISTNIPSELCIWVDPGEVSYRIGEKGTVAVLFRRNRFGREEYGHDAQEMNSTVSL